MLENDYSTSIGELLAKLPCDVEIPAEWGDYFSQQGLAPAIADDVRRFARKYFRAKAILQIQPTLPAIPRQQLVYAVYTRDISRHGVSFLHVQQLYPAERCQLWLSDQRLQVHVVRCSRVNSKCYIVGGTQE